ncbi:MAG: type II secretion system protein [Nitrospirae bacterium]|nr:type II secretion system protein [Nitrospirota bacterium]
MKKNIINRKANICEKAQALMGFTIIELLIVMTIIGILTSIAIPMYAGQREKAKIRALEASGKGVVSELQSYFDAYAANDPVIRRNRAQSTVEQCWESVRAANTTKTCNAIYNMAASGTYNTVNDVMNLFYDTHYTEKSPCDANQQLYTQGTPVVCTVNLEVDTSAKKVLLQVIGNDTSNPLLKQWIAAK